MGLCSALLFSSYSNAQTVEYSTGNIVLPTVQGAGSTPWVNGVYQDNLTCWKGGDPGYCGPNAIVLPGNNIHFSYGSSYIFQQQLISNILPAATGLRVDGYNFSFTAKNGNGWDDGRVDSLTALVRFWDSTGGRGPGSLLYGNTYDLNRKFNWTDFSYSETFQNPLNVPSIGHVQYGFLGRDNNGWAGPYGPEVNSVSFSVKYSVDPCATDVLSSPSCPGYSSALLASIQTKTTSVTEPTSVVVSQPPTESFTASDATSISILPSTASSTAPTTSTSTSTSSNTGTPKDPVSSAMTPPDPSPQPGSVTASTTQLSTTASGSSSSTRTGGGPSKTAMAAVKQVEAANQQLTASVNQQAVSSSAARIAAAQVQSSQIANQVLDMTSSSGSQQQTSSQSASMAMFGFTPMQGATNSNTQAVSNPLSGSNADRTSSNMMGPSSQQSSVFTGTGIRVNQSQASNSFTGVELTQPVFTQSTAVTQTVSSIQRNDVINREAETSFTLPNNNIASRTNFVSDLMSGAQLPPNTGSVQQADTTVKQNVQPNELAGGVDLVAMATQPQGYASYSFALTDAPFYAPKEIYRNQTTVDNARALRQLSSDRLHRQMVDQQYNKGK